MTHIDYNPCTIKKTAFAILPGVLTHNTQFCLVVVTKLLKLRLRLTTRYRTLPLIPSRDGHANTQIDKRFARQLKSHASFLKTYADANITSHKYNQTTMLSWI